MTTIEAAAVLDVTPKTVVKWCHEGKLSAVLVKSGTGLHRRTRWVVKGWSVRSLKDARAKALNKKLDAAH